MKCSKCESQIFVWKNCPDKKLYEIRQNNLLSFLSPFVTKTQMSTMSYKISQKLRKYWWVGGVWRPPSPPDQLCPFKSSVEALNWQSSCQWLAQGLRHHLGVKRRIFAINSSNLNFYLKSYSKKKNITLIYFPSFLVLINWNFLKGVLKVSNRECCPHFPFVR